MKFDIVHSARQGRPFSEPPGLPEVRLSGSIAAIGIASLIALFVLAFVNLALTAPALASNQPPYTQVTHAPSGEKS